ncbi:hypothetical protein [Cellvibrio fontiphilus]|uniref:Type II secretion system protein GspC N-terminal domain-containing protein n=1 Tax=Cellvibrio fontiphilus TaxID=1815559 RepID=A0ABV7FC23_9GAMM
MNRSIAFGYIAALVVLNLIFWFFPRGMGEEDLATDKKDRWQLVAFLSPAKMDLNQLLESGFWGDASEALAGASSDAKQDTPEVERREAAKLRANVNAIIERDDTREVLFLVGKDYVRVQVNQSLPGTDWELVEIGADWLMLTKSGGGGEKQLLRLFQLPSKAR